MRVASSNGLRFRLALIVALWAIPGLTWAQQAHFELDVRELRVGETAALRLVLTGGVADAMPVLPASDQLRFAVQRPQRERVTLNFQTTRITTYNWSITAIQAGTAAIGPARLQVGGKTLRVRPVTLEIHEPDPGDAGPNLLVAALEPTPEDLAAGQPVPLWQGQALVYRFSFSHRDVLYDARWTQPDYAGLEPIPGVEQDQKEYALERDGHATTVHDVLVPLVASEVGDWEIAPSVIKAQFPVERSRRRRSNDPFEQFFGGGVFPETRAEVLASNPVTVRIDPLPSSGRPDDFGGWVGSFQVRAELGETRVRAGDSVTLTVTVRGDGILNGLRLPPLPESESLRAYDDEPEVQGGLAGGRYQSRAVLRRALVPMAEGTVQVPSVELVWFDPAQGRYVDWVSPALELEVSPGEGGEAVVMDFTSPEAETHEAVRSLGEDILPIHTDVQVHDQRFSPWQPLPLFLLLLPGVALLGQVVTDLRAQGGQRSRRVRAVRGQLDRLPTERVARLAALEAAFREASGLALSCPPAGVSPDRLLEGLPEPLGTSAAELYARLERARYGGGTGELEQAVADLVARLLKGVR